MKVFIRILEVLAAISIIVTVLGACEEKVTTTSENEGKRILLISNESGEPQYKSIFIKNTHRLKIIKMGNEGQIFNEISTEK